MSNISFLGINENFPVAGQDNDTQVFRDNFDTIKSGLRTANTEITDLQDNTARTDRETSFNYNNLIEVVLRQHIEAFNLTSGSSEKQELNVDNEFDWQVGSYQIYQVSGNRTISLTNFPGDPETSYNRKGMGKVRLELYKSTDVVENATLQFTTSSGTVIKSNGFDTAGSPTITLSSSSNPIIIDIWRHSASTIFMQTIGVFS